MQLGFSIEKKVEDIAVSKPCKWCKHSNGYCTVCGNKGFILYAKFISVDVLVPQTDGGMAA